MSNFGCAREGDTTHGVCSHPDHDPPITIPGRIITASGNVNANGRRLARRGDTVQADCGHKSYIVTGSGSKVAANGQDRPVARLGDNIAGGPYIATIVTASTDVFQDN